MNEITFKPIGYIHTEYENLSQIPKSSTQSLDREGKIVIDKKYLDAMSDIKIDEEYMVIFYFHKSETFKQKVPLRGCGPITGLFSTHAPNRPNPIGVSSIIIKDVNGNIITFNGVDMLNNTPILDLKKIYR